MTDDKQSTDSRADKYHDFEIDLPFTTHPFSALKSHNIQFGIALGVILAFLAQSSISITFDIVVMLVSMSGLAISVMVMLTITLWAIGIENAGLINAAEADKNTIGAVQIRRKPHYLTTPMVIVFVMFYAVLSVV